MGTFLSFTFICRCQYALRRREKLDRREALQNRMRSFASMHQLRRGKTDELDPRRSRHPKRRSVVLDLYIVWTAFRSLRYPDCTLKNVNRGRSRGRESRYWRARRNSHSGCAHNGFWNTYRARKVCSLSAAMVNVLRPANRMPSRDTNKANCIISLNCTLLTGART